MRHTTPARLLLGVLGVGLVLYLAGGSVQKTRDDRRVRMSVRLVSATPIRAAGLQAVRDRDHFGAPLESVSPNSLRYGAPDEGLRGEWFEVLVPGGNRPGVLGCAGSYSQVRLLAVVADLADGRRVAKVVELPDARESHEVTVALD